MERFLSVADKLYPAWQVGCVSERVASRVSDGINVEGALGCTTSLSSTQSQSLVSTSSTLTQEQIQGQRQPVAGTVSLQRGAPHRLQRAGKRTFISVSPCKLQEQQLQRKATQLGAIEEERFVTEQRRRVARQRFEQEQALAAVVSERRRRLAAARVSTLCGRGRRLYFLATRIVYLYPSIVRPPWRHSSPCSRCLGSRGLVADTQSIAVGAPYLPFLIRTTRTLCQVAQLQPHGG